MPLALTVTVLPPQSRLHVAQDVSLWQRLQQLARRSILSLLIFWRALFADLHRALDPERLQATLRSPALFDTETYVMGLWETLVDQEARALLPVLLRETMVETGQVVAPEMAEVAGLPIPFVPGLDEPRQALHLYANTQVTLIGATTLRGVRALERLDEAEALPAFPVGAALGLTPVQIRHLTHARTRWAAAGRSVTQVQRATQEAIAQGLATRTQVIAETQAYGTVNLAHHQAMLQAAQVGGVELRGYWQVQPGACLQCLPIPGMNVNGVPLGQPFQSPDGPIITPPRHPMCRCVIAYRRGGV